MITRYTVLDYVTRADMGANIEHVNNSQNAHKELTQSVTLAGTEYNMEAKSPRSGKGKALIRQYPSPK